ncbi:MAG: hypothetical protein IKB25_09450, partial [Lentisphaeria bacterium]|nr:hypothetical protein [Lentisphaeria bacterium]
ASKQASKQAFIYNKGLLLSDRSFSGRQFPIFSDFQGMGSLCLEKLYQFNFTAAKSSNGLSRLFFAKKMFFLAFRLLQNGQCYDIIVE